MCTETHAGRRLRSDHAYEALKRRLLVGEFALNVRLGEERHAVLLGVSRTPIREAPGRGGQVHAVLGRTARARAR